MGQTSWQPTDYAKWDHTNFRSNQKFHQTFSTTDPDYQLLNAAVFYLTNVERTNRGVSALPHHELLEVAAYNHSMKMATTGFFSHTNTVDKSRASTEDRGHLAGIANPKFAENIAYNYPDVGSTYLQVATKLIDQWMNSPGHRSNILSTEGKQMGAGTYYYSGKIYGTQVFQWFYFVQESPAGGIDKLPSTKNISNSSNNQNTITSNTQNSKTNSNVNVELEKLKLEIENLKSSIIKKDQTISQLNSDKLNLNNTINQRERELYLKEVEYKQLYDEYKSSSKRNNNKRTVFNKSGETLLKMGAIAFYPNILKSQAEKFEESLISYGGDFMFGVNYGERSKKNTLGLTVRAIQTNKNLTELIDGSSAGPKQYYDAEITTIYKEWFSLGLGVSYQKDYGSIDYKMGPSASLGLCLGPKDWKVQVFQQTSLLRGNHILGRASLGFSLVL